MSEGADQVLITHIVCITYLYSFLLLLEVCSLVVHLHNTLQLLYGEIHVCFLHLSIYCNKTF